MLKYCCPFNNVWFPPILVIGFYLYLSKNDFPSFVNHWIARYSLHSSRERSNGWCCSKIYINHHDSLISWNLISQSTCHGFEMRLHERFDNFFFSVLISRLLNWRASIYENIVSWIKYFSTKWKLDNNYTRFIFLSFLFTIYTYYIKKMWSSFRAADVSGTHSLKI